MKHLLNTLYVTSEDVYLALDGENVVAKREGDILARYPLHTLQNIISFSYAGASPALMGECAERGIGLNFCTPRGRFLARTDGASIGNVLLRRQQYRIADDDAHSCLIAQAMIAGKIYNARWSLERAVRDHKPRVDEAAIQNAIDILKRQLILAAEASRPDILRGIEGVAAAAYFGVLGQLFLRDPEAFSFDGRNRRPPLDRVNAMLSFSYSLLTSECASALAAAGLDAYVGFLHSDRPGRTSLALDLMEELRPVMADRFVVTAVNNRIVSPSDFVTEESGAVRMKDDARKRFLAAWQDRKKESISHPFLQEKMPWGLVPHIQAMLLARHLRGDLDAYPPFLWK